MLLCVTDVKALVNSHVLGSPAPHSKSFHYPHDCLKLNNIYTQNQAKSFSADTVRRRLQSHNTLNSVSLWLSGVNVDLQRKTRIIVEQLELFELIT